MSLHDLMIYYENLDLLFKAGKVTEDEYLKSLRVLGNTVQELKKKGQFQVVNL